MLLSVSYVPVSEPGWNPSRRPNYLMYWCTPFGWAAALLMTVDIMIPWSRNVVLPAGSLFDAWPRSMVLRKMRDIESMYAEARAH